MRLIDRAMGQPDEHGAYAYLLKSMIPFFYMDNVQLRDSSLRYAQNDKLEVLVENVPSVI